MQKTFCTHFQFSKKNPRHFITDISSFLAAGIKHHHLSCKVKKCILFTCKNGDS